MCRLVAGRSWGREGSRLLGELVGLVAEAAAGDPYLKAVTGGEDRHCHGYGFIVVYRSPSGGWRLVYERFDALSGGLGEEEACRANLEASRGAAERLRGLLATVDEALVVFHVRRAGRGEPRGSLNAHPYRVEAFPPGGYVEAYLAHNGGLVKEGLARELGVNAPAYTDSHLLAIRIARRLAAGVDASTALAEGFAHAKSGYDVALVVVEDKLRGINASLWLAAGMAGGLDEARRKYYEPVLFHAAAAAGYVSSTVRDLAVERGVNASFEEARPGVYRVDGGRGAVFVRGF
ncbi:MAG: hypothetical protein DSY37_04230 [Hyperthermus sp.]|nr:MAG: hypothetical protein DSY37_04230 [Hyperthermus sp.]